MENNDLRYVEGYTVKWQPGNKNDIRPENLEIVCGYFHKWHTESSEGTTELYGIVENYEGKIILVPYKQLTFMDKPKIPEWALKRLSNSLLEIKNIMLSSTDNNREIFDIVEELEDLIDQQMNLQRNFFYE